MSANVIRLSIVDPSVAVPNADQYTRGCYLRIMQYAACAIDGPKIVDSPQLADVVLFPVDGGEFGPCFEHLRRTELFRANRKRAVVYSTNDLQFPAVPGLYAGCISRWYRRAYALPAHYLSVNTPQHVFQASELMNKSILYSFIGSSRTHPVRRRIVADHHSEAVIIDATPNGSPEYWWQRSDRDTLQTRYREIMAQSQFVLCPRGVSPLSYRLFDAMSAAAVPVVISDDVRLPAGPDWRSFCLIVAEREVESIPALIKDNQARAKQMGAIARAEWDRHFSPERSLTYLATLAVNIVSHRQCAGTQVDSICAILQMCTSWHTLRSKARFLLKGK